MWWWTTLAAIIILALSPAIPLIVAETILRHKVDMNESNSTIATLPWYLFFTIPIGAILSVLWIIRGLVYLYL